MMRFNRIGTRLLSSVAGVVIFGVIALTLTYALRQEVTMQREVESSLVNMTNSIKEGLSTLMASGHADAAKEFAVRLKNIANVIDYRILRPDGSEAFIDNNTIKRVNNKLGDTRFSIRQGDPESQQVLASTDPDLVRLTQSGERVFNYVTLPGGDRQVTVLSPIRPTSVCHRCHGEGNAMLGILLLTTSLNEIDHDAAQTWTRSIFIILAALSIIIGLIYSIAQKTLVSPIANFSRAMKKAADGDMSVRLPVTHGNEIGYMAQSFNQMNQNLQEIYGELETERNKLNTVIQSTSSGIIVTNKEEYIVLVNKAAQTILGKEKKTIIDEGFLRVFDDPEWMQEQLAMSIGNNLTAVREWQDKVLSVQISILFDDGGSSVGSAMLIRDITEERRLEKQLLLESITDALTGLHNRRHFDEMLTTEFMRWRRYKHPVSLAMLDIDHFKKFNDTHGHDCGDRVLMSIGALLNECQQTFKLIPCRYGGEEMVVIMPGIEVANALQIAETIRQKVAQLVIDGLKVTVSIGVAGCPGCPANDSEALLKLADEALYLAKENGRNQVKGAPAHPPAQ